MFNKLFIVTSGLSLKLDKIKVNKKLRLGLQQVVLVKQRVPPKYETWNTTWRLKQTF